MVRVDDQLQDEAPDDEDTTDRAGAGRWSLRAPLLERYRFSSRDFRSFQRAVASGELTPASSIYRGPVAPPRPADVLGLPPQGSVARAALEEAGRAALRRGEVGVCVLAGGMATRFVQAGARQGGPLVKGAVEVTEGWSFLALKAAQARALAHAAGGRVPIAVMASFATEAGLRAHLDERGIAGPDVRLFAQGISLRVTAEGDVVAPPGDGPLPVSSYTTPGHGDFFPSLQQSGILTWLRAEGVRMLWLCNVDNLGATLDPGLVGLFGQLHREQDVTFLAETVERRPEDGDKVGVVARLTDAHGELLRILEGFRTPPDVKEGLEDVSINSFTLHLDALADDVALDVHAVEKEVEGRKVLQGETILCEASGARREDGSPRFRFVAVRVPRTGEHGRFFDGRFTPVKAPSDLDRARDTVAASLSELLPERSRRRQAAIDALRGLPDDGTGAVSTFWSPGRINIIGEHTDTSEGLCLPAAIDLGVWAAVRAQPDQRLLVRTNQFSDVVDIDLSTGTGSIPRWGHSLRGLLDILARVQVPLTGARIALESDLLPGSGMSSSAAFHLAVAAALVRAAGAALPPLALARVAQDTETALGLRVGILDPYAIVHARAGMALLLDCRDLRHTDVQVGLKQHVFVVGDTRRARGLVDSEYNARRAQAEEAARLLEGLCGRPVRALRDVTSADLAAHAYRLPPVLAARATHVVEENARVALAARALAAGDAATLGILMTQSHRSLRDLFEVSVAELDALVEAALALGSDVVPGARMMGGGFGGCTLSLVRSDSLDRFRDEVGRAYRARTGLDASFTAVGAAPGLGECWA